MSPVLLIVIGGAAFLMIIGAGVAIVAGGDQRVVDERLEEFVSTTAIIEEPDEIIGKRNKKDLADKVDKALSGQGFFEPIRERVARADAKLRVSEYIILMVVCSIGAAIAAFIFLDGNLILALLAAVFGLRIPKMYIGFAAGRRIKSYNDQLGDTLTLWVNALRAGSSVLQGMETIATESLPPIATEFERVVQEVRLGLSVEQALANMYRRVPSEDLDLVITAVNIQREVGGNLAEVLDNISFTIRERVRIKGEIRTLTAQGRISGYIITFLPIALGFMLYLINREYISQLWIREEPFLIGEIPCGWLVIAISVFMISMGGLAIRKIVDIEV